MTKTPQGAQPPSASKEYDGMTSMREWGRQLGTRYLASPGVIPLRAADAITPRIFRSIADPVPLLAAIQRRWLPNGDSSAPAGWTDLVYLSRTPLGTITAKSAASGQLTPLRTSPARPTGRVAPAIASAAITDRPMLVATVDDTLPAVATTRGDKSALADAVDRQAASRAVEPRHARAEMVPPVAASSPELLLKQPDPHQGEVRRAETIAPTAMNAVNQLRLKRDVAEAPVSSVSAASTPARVAVQRSVPPAQAGLAGAVSSTRPMTLIQPILQRTHRCVLCRIG